jgi:chemotaxis protein MotB
MSPKPGARPIIVVKKKKAAHAHHGGSWKVAYADFVTAMMAFFLVMWIMGMDQDVRDMVQGYFNNPLGVHRDIPSGLNPITSGMSIQNPGSGVPGSGIAQQQVWFEAVARNLESAFQGDEYGGVDVAFEVAVTPEGLRIELMETGPEEVFFEKGRAEVRPILHQVLRTVAGELRGSEHEFVVEGHTDARPFVASAVGYGNWELSVDRANAARRILEDPALGTLRVREVRGYAARVPRVADDPFAPQNRRVSLLVPFRDVPRVSRIFQDPSAVYDAARPITPATPGQLP